MIIKSHTIYRKEPFFCSLVVKVLSSLAKKGKTKETSRELPPAHYIYPIDQQITCDKPTADQLLKTDSLQCTKDN